jgi:hypothetical protein
MSPRGKPRGNPLQMGANPHCQVCCPSGTEKAPDKSFRLVQAPQFWIRGLLGPDTLSIAAVQIRTVGPVRQQGIVVVPGICISMECGENSGLLPWVALISAMIREVASRVI